MNCPQCGTPLPDQARFCFGCGAALGGATAPPPPPLPSATSASPGAIVGTTTGADGVQALKCPQCGAPVHPVFGEMVISCDYCGGSVTLGGSGWKAINKHTILLPKVSTPEEALAIVHQHVDNGFLHRKDFEESKIVEQRLSFVPFWIVPVSATTNFVFTDIAVSVGSTVGTIAAAELLGSALGGRRGGGGFIALPLMMGSPVNASRTDTVTGAYEYPVVAVKGMSAYQPKNYEFQLADRTFFDKKALPPGAVVLNGDLGEDAAQHAARSYVLQLQAEEAHKRRTMVSQLNGQAEVSEPELLHVPVWYFLLDRRGQKAMILVDAHAGQVMQTVG